jgi:prepilin-type processing-associated H-X9-DG protein
VQEPADVQWTGDIHKHAGNIGFADGSVAQVNTDRLRKTLQSTLDAGANAPIRLVVP